MIQNAVPRPAPNSFYILIAKILIVFVSPNESLKRIVLSPFVGFCQLCFLVRAIRFCDRFGDRSGYGEIPRGTSG